MPYLVSFMESIKLSHSLDTLVVNKSSVETCTIVESIAKLLDFELVSLDSLLICLVFSFNCRSLFFTNELLPLRIVLEITCTYHFSKA